MTATSENDDWLTDELMQRASKLIQDIEAFPSQGTVYVVSRALYEAEKRGREEERKAWMKERPKFVVGHAASKRHRDD